MALDHLSPDDLEVVRQCLLATVGGPFLPDWEFQTLMGLTRAEITDIATSWPSDERQFVAVNNALNNLLGYPHKQHNEWTQYISVNPTEVAQVLARWRGEERDEHWRTGWPSRLL